MKNASSILIAAAATLCSAPGAGAQDGVLLPQQQNCNRNMKVDARKRPLHGTLVIENATPDIGKKRSPAPGERPIDLVICLDTSNSMDGLIGSAKQKIWDIVNELATAKPKPHLRVGLYAYGSPSFGQQNGFVHKVVDLSDDLDKVFTELTALGTNGGDEYCARVISTSANRQLWSPGKSLKILVVAGNESATQDPKLDVFQTAKQTIARGIIINTIYCGPASASDANDWRRLAAAADGQFAAIDQNGTIVVSTPFDQKIAELSHAINNTYVAYGKGGYYGQQKQMAADSASLQMGASNFASRAMAKASGQYRNSSWDLLDASTEESFDLSKLKKEELPKEMQNMTLDAQKKYINEKAKQRTEIQKQISDLNAQRARFIQTELAKSGKATDKVFEAAMLKALREQALRNGFTFESK